MGLRGFVHPKKVDFFILGLSADNQKITLKKVAQVQFDNTCYLGRVVIFSGRGFQKVKKRPFSAVFWKEDFSDWKGSNIVQYT